jgi:hypothetical protein
MATAVTFTTSGGDQVERSQDRIEKKQRQGRREVELSNREIQKFGQTQRQVLLSVETAQETYNRKMREAKIALAGNARETELMARVSGKLEKEYFSNTQVRQKLTQQIQAEIGLLRGERNEYTQSGPVLKNFAIDLDKVRKANLAAFGQPVIGRVQRFTALLRGASGVLAGLATAGAALDESAQFISGYGQKAITATKAGGGLAQLAGGDPAKLRQLLDASRESFRGGGYETLDEAHRLTFEIESGGILRDRAFLARLQAASVEDAAQVARDTSLVAAAFGREEAGFTEQLVSKGIAAATPATGANLADVLQGVAFASATAKELGISDEEVFALVSQISEVTGSGIKAGTQANSLFRSFVRKGYVDERSKSLEELLAELLGKNFKPSKLIEELGRQEAGQAFSIAKDIPAFRQRLAEIREAESSNLAGRVIESALAQPEIGTRRSVLAHKANAQLELTEKGLRRQRIEALQEQQRAGFYAELPGPFAYLIDKLYTGGSLFGIPIPGGSSFVPDALEDPGIRDPEVRNRMEVMVEQMEEANRQREQQKRLQERSAKAAEDTNKKLDKLPAAPRVGSG